MGLRGDGVGRRVVPDGFLTGMAATVQTSRWDGSWYRPVLCGRTGVPDAAGEGR